MKLLICAFEPFGGRRRNTSADLLRKFKKTDLNNRPVTYAKCLLPVNFTTAWPRLQRRIHKHSPDFIMLLGEGKENLITIEYCAKNSRRTEDRPCHIESDAPNTLTTRFDQTLLEDMVAEIAERHNSDVRIEYNAGDFLCNYVYFQTLHNFPKIPTVFLHIRPMEEQEFFAHEKKLVAILAAITHSIQQTVVLHLRKSN